MFAKRRSFDFQKTGLLACRILEMCRETKFRRHFAPPPPNMIYRVTFERCQLVVVWRHADNWTSDTVTERHSYVLENWRQGTVSGVRPDGGVVTAKKEPG